MSISVRIMGDDVAARDPFEATTMLADVPREGDIISIWTGDGEVFLTVEKVIWPAFAPAHDPTDLSPIVHLRREGGYDDTEWSDFFDALKENRQP